MRSHCSSFRSAFVTCGDHSFKFLVTAFSTAQQSSLHVLFSYDCSSIQTLYPHEPISDSVTVLSHSFHTRSIIVSLEFIYQYLKATLEAFTPGQLFYKKKGQSSAPRKLIKRAIYSSVTANKRCHRHQVQSSFLMPSLKTRLSCFSTVTMRPFPSC